MRSLLQLSVVLSCLAGLAAEVAAQEGEGEGGEGGEEGSLVILDFDNVSLFTNELSARETSKGRELADTYRQDGYVVQVLDAGDHLDPWFGNDYDTDGTLNFHNETLSDPADDGNTGQNTLFLAREDGRPFDLLGVQFERVGFRDTVTFTPSEGDPVTLGAEGVEQLEFTGVLFVEITTTETNPTSTLLDDFVVREAEDAGGGDVTPPEVACFVERDLLFPFGLHRNVELAWTVSDDDPETSVEVFVFSDEPDGSSRLRWFWRRFFRRRPRLPDAVFSDSGDLWLRADRGRRSNGRVYLIVVAATDSAGNTGFDCCTVGVPRNWGRRARRSVWQQAAFAEEACRMDGTPPEGFELLADFTDGP